MLGNVEASNSPSRLSRRAWCAAAGSAALATSVPSFSRAAGPLVLRCGTDTQATQLTTLSVVAMCEAIEKASNGAVKISLFPASILGNASAMVSQLRNGALDFALISGANLGGVEPLCNIEGVGFAFPDNTVAYRAMDGALGQLIRKRLLDTGIFTFDRVLGAGFTQFMNGVHPIRTPADLAGLKMRTPTSRVIINLLQTLGGSPVPIALAEVYTSLQTHVVDGIVITLDGFEGAHLYEVQKYLSVLNPVWAGRYFLASSTIWKGLPPDVAALIQHNVTKFALDERARIDNSDTDYITKLTQQGMTVVRPQAAPFKAKCGPHYAWCKETFGDQAWNLLEQSTGRLA
jgi:tripartite ATP-independent transporter DctP family solute receptor